MVVIGTFTESPCVPGQMPYCVLGPGEFPSSGSLQGSPLPATGNILPPTEERIGTSFAPKWSPGLISNSVDLFFPRLGRVAGGQR